MNQEELHLQLSNPATKTLAWSKAKAQPLEVFCFHHQPSLRVELLWLDEKLGVTAHCIYPYLHQRLQGRGKG